MALRADQVLATLDGEDDLNVDLRVSVGHKWAQLHAKRPASPVPLQGSLA